MLKSMPFSTRLCILVITVEQQKQRITGAQKLSTLLLAVY